MYYSWGRNKMTFSQGMEGKPKGKTFNFKTYLKQRKKNHALQLQIFLTKKNLMLGERLNQA